MEKIKSINLKRVATVLFIVMVLLWLFNVLTGCESIIRPTWNYDWEDNGEMEILRERMVSDLSDEEIDPTSLILDFQEDGSFASVDYYSEKQDTWHPAKHLKNILAMQKAVYTPENSFYKDQSIIDKVNKAIMFWVNKEFYCDWNGWWNGLGVGPDVADILMFENIGLEQKYIDSLTEKVYQISLLNESKNSSVKEREVNSTGGNLTDKVSYSLKYCVIKRDGGSIKFLRRLLENELRPFPSKKAFSHRWDVEGIKADMSFMQHFELLYLGGYGEVFCNGINFYIEKTSATQFALSDTSLNLYQDFLLDGMQFAFRGEYRDINASGRGIVRKDELKGIYSQVIKGCLALLNSGVELSREEELSTLLVNRTKENDIGAGGHKYFWNSDYQSYNDKNYMATVRAASKRTKNSEALNGENILGHYLGAGATFYYVKGDEYFNIPPLLNWNKIPGTTTAQGYLPVGKESYSRMGKTSFVGGVSNGKVGMSCLDYNDNKVKAKKAWFMFEDGVVCLGADIKSSQKDIYTNINQTLLRGNVVVGTARGKSSNQYMQLNEKVDWVYNNGIGYISDQTIQLKAENRKGDWKSVSDRVDSQMYSDDILELGISHGNKPKNASYNYTVLMNRTVEGVEEYYLNPNLVTLENSNDCQAVYDRKNKILQSVFWNSGSLNLPNGNTLKVSSGCTLIYDLENNRVFISNPQQTTKTITLTLNGVNYKVAFQKGMYGGQTKEVSLNYN